MYIPCKCEFLFSGLLCFETNYASDVPVPCVTLRCLFGYSAATFYPKQFSFFPWTFSVTDLQFESGPYNYAAFCVIYPSALKRS